MNPYDLTIYLCGPIAGCSDEECREWRDYVKERHSNCIDPMKRDFRGLGAINHDKVIVELDKRDIRNSDVLLVNPFKSSVGTSMEMIYAWELGKAVVTVMPDYQISPWLKYHSTIIVDSLDEALDKIHRFV